MMDLSKYTASYDHGPLLRRLAWIFFSKLCLDNFLPIPSIFKVKLLRIFGASIGNAVVIKPNVQVKYPWNLSIGDNTWIGEHVWIDNLGNVSIGSNVCISQGAYLLTGNHDYSLESFDLIVKPIIIENGAWIGAQATVCPGVVLEEGAVLTVASLATGRLEAYGIYQGIPAKLKKHRKFQ